MHPIVSKFIPKILYEDGIPVLLTWDWNVSLIIFYISTYILVNYQISNLSVKAKSVMSSNDGYRIWRLYFYEMKTLWGHLQ